MIFDIDIRYRSSGSTISVTYDIEEQRYRSFSYDIDVLATILKTYNITRIGRKARAAGAGDAIDGAGAGGDCTVGKTASGLCIAAPYLAPLGFTLTLLPVVTRPCRSSRILCFRLDELVS